MTATINDLRSKRAVKAAELICLDDLIRSLQTHFNGATAEKPAQDRGRAVKTVCSPTPERSSPIVALSGEPDVAEEVTREEVMGVRGVITEGCCHEGPEGRKCALARGHRGDHRLREWGWVTDWQVAQRQTEANIAISAALEVKHAATAPVPVTVPRVWGEGGGNEGVSACSPEGVKIGATLVEPFSSTDLQARLDGNASARAYQWVAAWKAKGWVVTTGFGIYKRSPKWPEVVA